MRQGWVVAVCLSPVGGIPKYRQVAIAVGPDGVIGDYHAGPWNRHKKRGEPEANWRQLTIVAQEILNELNDHFGLTLEPGALGENLTIEGLGDLADLQAGDQLIIGDVVLEVKAQNKPCSTLAVYHPELVKALYGRRGVCTIVRQGGLIRPGDRVNVNVQPRSV